MTRARSGCCAPPSWPTPCCGPGTSGESTVSAHVTVIAPLPTLAGSGCDHPAEILPPGSSPAPVEPGEVDGHPITAGQLRELLTQLDSLCPGGLQAPTGGTLGIALTDPATGALRATVTRAELERLVRRGCRAHPDGDCGCPVLDRPAPVDRYRHTPAQERFVRARDRTCRHPGCTGRAAWADLDHVAPHDDGGPTDCGNLCCLCRRHHRLKTHAQGWRYVDDHRRRAHGDHPRRRSGHPHHPPTRLARARRRATPPERHSTGDRRPAPVPETDRVLIATGEAARRPCAQL